jgi:hypothetical protein
MAESFFGSADGLGSLKTMVNATRTTRREKLSRWQRGIARALLLTGALLPAWSTDALVATINTDQYTAIACNQPFTASPKCPNASPASGYIERQLAATLSKCKDPTAAAPRCACG